MADDVLKSEYHVPSSWDLKRINTRANLYEESEGPLIAMGNEDGNTFLTFDNMQDPPAKPVTISKRAGAAPSAPTLVASGDIYIEGALVTCDATRGP
jgi:hypothetical protein